MCGSRGKVTFLIPALNEAETIGHVIRAAQKCEAVDQILVVDNGSTDDTGRVARELGAEVTCCPERGLGHAIKAGLAAAKNRWVVKADGDMQNFETRWISVMLDAIDEGVGLVKSYWPHEVSGWPETYFLIKPMLRRIDPRLATVRMPISGVYSVDTMLLDVGILANDWSIDLDLVYRVSQQGASIREVELPEVQHNERPLSAYFEMADQLLAYLLRIAHRHSHQHMLLVMAHPDDAEIWVGGSLVKHLLDGGTADLVILSGTEERRAEADVLAGLYRGLTVHHSGSEGGQQIDNSEARALIERVASARRPFAVITHAPGDPHPDHISTNTATHSALMRLAHADAPARLLYCNGYFGGNLHLDGFKPDTFVDISDVAETKYAAIRNHVSQDPELWVEMAGAMDILNGMRCGARRAEAYRRSPYPFFQESVETLI
ncbi:MAG: glucosyl-3-phosphoglycerate synthase [Sphingomonadales bacterium]|jgi:LmbE family N-acetylglucosaminyl deacetylase/molybdopterin-guanine dinucleotide biosynthesis protein A|nr:glucosyl-3-phosphoglycerate synthase [Sphingomonadales bacterium]